MDSLGKLYKDLLQILEEGTLFEEGVMIATNNPSLNLRFPVYAMGFMHGQAEKVYSGACPAAMFRPSEEYYSWAIQVLGTISEHYALRTVEFLGLGEIWIYKHPSTLILLDYLNSEVSENSVMWHTIRAYLCGIKEVNLDYHKTLGFGERVEP